MIPELIVTNKKEETHLTDDRWLVRMSERSTHFRMTSFQPSSLRWPRLVGLFTLDDFSPRFALPGDRPDIVKVSLKHVQYMCALRFRYIRANAKAKKIT